MKSVTTIHTFKGVLLTGLILLASCRGASSIGAQQLSDSAPTLLQDLAPLKQWFAEASDRPRALALLSPT